MMAVGIERADGDKQRHRGRGWAAWLFMWENECSNIYPDASYIQDFEGLPMYVGVPPSSPSLPPSYS